MKPTSQIRFCPSDIIKRVFFSKKLLNDYHITTCCLWSHWEPGAGAGGRDHCQEHETLSCAGCLFISWQNLILKALFCQTPAHPSGHFYITFPYPVNCQCSLSLALLNPNGAGSIPWLGHKVLDKLCERVTTTTTTLDGCLKQTEISSVLPRILYIDNVLYLYVTLFLNFWWWSVKSIPDQTP